MFKIGDRVKNYRGWTGTIVALQLHSCPYTVQWDGGSVINYIESEIELLPPQPLTVKELEQILFDNVWSIDTVFEKDRKFVIKDINSKVISEGQTIEEALYKLKTVVGKEKMPETPSYM